MYNTILAKNKIHRKLFPIQEPYHIKVSLQIYYELIKSGKWEIPDFSDKCLICSEKDCATYHGCYERGAKCPITVFFADDLPILRYLCHNKGINRKCNHRTFSLLPLILVPYRQLSLKFIILSLYIRLHQGLTLEKSITVIEKEYPSLQNFGDIVTFLSVSAQIEWEKIVMSALALFISRDIGIVKKELYVKMKDDPNKGLILFLELAIEYESSHENPSIRGPDSFAWDFYRLSGGADQLAPFLFGTASQQRKIILLQPLQ